jgi:hypothetical protein
VAITDDVIGLYHYNNTPDDDSGGGWDGTVTGATYSSSVKKFGSHSIFGDGADDYITYPTAKYSGLTTGSINKWFKTGSLREVISIIHGVSRDADSTRTELIIGMDQRVGSTSQDIFCDFWVDGTRQWLLSVPRAVFNARTNFNWNHLCLRHGGIEPALSINDVDVTAFTVSTDKTKWWADLLTATNPADTAADMALFRNGGYSLEFEGYIDEKVEYSRAITDSELTQLYNATQELSLGNNNRRNFLLFHRNNA